MTSLEFIDKEIEKEKSIIKTYEEFFKTDKTEFDKQMTRGYIQIHQKNINLLNQIKTELEAWEAIKSELVIEKHVANSYEDEYRTITFKSGCIDDIEILENKSKINTISKALEVKDEFN